VSTLSRSARGWTELGAHVVLLLIGLGGMQVAAERTNRRIDLTPGRALSLAPATRKLLAEVTAPLRITVFFRRGTRERHADLVRLFADANPRIAFELLDLDRFPERARSLGVTSYGRAAIEYGGRRAVVLAAPEEELAGGVRRVVQGRRRHLVFTTGHGEREPGGAADGYGRLAAALGAEDYVAGAASLVDGPVPDGTDVLLVAGPRHDFLLPELDAVARYLAAGGGVVMLLDPAPLPNVAKLLASMGIQLGDDMIVDRERRVLGTDGLAAVVELFKRGNPVSDPSANPIESGVVLPSARTVDVAEASGVDTCFYDLVGDDDFILGPVPGATGLFTGVGWRGTGYKFAPWVGRVLAQLAIQRGTVYDIARFAPGRFAGAARPERKASVA